MKRTYLLLLSLFLTVNLGFSQSKYTVTAYCACVKCCGPNAHNRTANGKIPKQGVTIAASRSIPFGTKLHIEGVGIRIVEDRLSKKYDNRIDVFFYSHQEALKFGKKVLTVKKI
jgi:3D (Asp-Asp-Asp) domain-containing protein